MALPSTSLPYRERLRRLRVLADSPYASPTREAAREEVLRLKAGVYRPRLQEGYTRAEAADAVQALADQLHDLGPRQTVENWVHAIRTHGFWPIVVHTADRYAKNPTISAKNRALYRRAHSIMLRIRDGHTVRQHELLVEQWRREWARSLKPADQRIDGVLRTAKRYGDGIRDVEVEYHGARYMVMIDPSLGATNVRTAIGLHPVTSPLLRRRIKELALASSRRK